MRRRPDLFTTVRTEGGLLPSELLARVVAGDPTLPGLAPADYHLAPGETRNEAINRAWNRLAGAWASFAGARAALREGDPATGVTRDRWLLPLFSELGYGRLQASKTIEIGEKRFPLSHQWAATPIHLVGAGVPLDRRTAGVAGASQSSPHALVQELLNGTDSCLWGVVSNGLLLRILRDNVSLTRQAYVQFDLEAMMTGEVYADFALLWLLLHQSRMEGERPEDCWLERWSSEAQAQGTRALDHLRDGVAAAIEALGRGFLTHRANARLRQELRSGALDKQDYYRQLLRLVYRLLFLFVAEDRELLADPEAPENARLAYRSYYSLDRLRRLSEHRRGTAHHDLYRGLVVVMDALGADQGCAPLGLPALGSFLWSLEAMPALAGCEVANRDLLEAVRALAFIEESKVLRAVDYRNLGSEELGSVYESLLELHPELSLDAGTFELATAGGHERKTTGSYYTPTSLITELLNSALDPLLEEATAGADPVAALLGLKVVDPACGSGHFLIAAAHRVAKRLAAVRTGDEEPGPKETRKALRDVIGHCIYGVDVNEMAVELCKVSLWMEALEPGKPLSFLDHRIACGNSLLGATPALLAAGIPDEAFKPIEGDDKKVVADLRKRNARERKGQQTLELLSGVADLQEPLAAAVAGINALDDGSIVGVREKERRYRGLLGSPEASHAKLVADAWCAAFVGRKVAGGEPLTEANVRRLQVGPDRVGQATVAEIEALAEQYRFLHWHLAFPDVFEVPGDDEEPTNRAAGWNGGFDLVLGNPPWERVKLQEKEWFAARRPEIAAAPNAAARRRMIAALEEDDPPLYQAFIDARREAEGESHSVRDSGRYPLCGRGDINTYAVFAEAMRSVVSATGQAGVIVPSGIATDDTTKFFFADIVASRSLASLYDFENAAPLFEEVHRSYKFCLLTLSGPGRPVAGGADFVFFAHTTADLRDEERRFQLSAEDLALLNPNTRTCPVFRSRRDAELTKAIYRRVPVLVAEGPPARNPWGVSFMRMFDMTNDSGLFRTRAQLESDGWTLEGNVFHRGAGTYLPLYEAKMLHYFDHRWATYEASDTREMTSVEKADAGHRAIPKYWVPMPEVVERLPSNPLWLVALRGICRSTDERTIIATALPTSAVGNSAPLFVVDGDQPVALAAANLSSLVLDFCSRSKVGGINLNFFIIDQLPMLPPSEYEKAPPWDSESVMDCWCGSRLLELSYTAWDLAPFSADLGYDGPPFRWDEERRAILRAELDAAFFHLYGIERGDVDYIMETFPIVKRKDVGAHGEYRTKRLILECYDAMAEAAATGVPYRTILDPPPADPRVAHPARAVTPVGALARLRLVGEAPAGEEYRTYAPVYSLKAAAGGFSDAQGVDAAGWLEVPGRRLRPGMFVTQVVGRSMEPAIPDGSWCLFRGGVEGSRDGKTLLVQHRGIADPETGGSYTVKRYRSRKAPSGDGSWHHTEIRLEPINSEFQPIVLSDVSGDEFQVIAELVEVLGPRDVVTLR